MSKMQMLVLMSVCSLVFVSIFVLDSMEQRYFLNKLVHLNESLSGLVIPKTPTQLQAPAEMEIPRRLGSKPEEETKKKKINKPVLFIGVFSGPTSKHRYNRDVIRMTWWNDVEQLEAEYQVHARFLIGKTQDLRQQRLNEEERTKYGDLVILDMEDSYYNLWEKSYLMFNHSLACCGADYFIKVDDDCFMNPRLFMEYAKPKLDPRMLYGNMVMNGLPDRNPNSKYYISKEEYPRDILPTYPSGIGYMVGKAVMRFVVNNAVERLTHLKIDDINIGLWVEKAEEMGEFVPVYVQQKLGECGEDDAIVVHFIRPESRICAWKHNRGLSGCC